MALLAGSGPASCDHTQRQTPSREPLTFLSLSLRTSSMSTISTTPAGPAADPAAAAAAAPAAAPDAPPAASCPPLLLRTPTVNVAEIADMWGMTGAFAAAQPVGESAKWKMHHTVQEFDTPLMRDDLPKHHVPVGTKGLYMGEQAVVVDYDASLPCNYSAAGDECLVTLAWERGRVRVPKTMFLDEALKMWTPKDQDGDAAGGEAKRKHDGECENVKSQAASAARAKKQKVAAAANENPTGVAVVLFCVMNATLHVMGFQEDRHRWPDGVREEWDKLFLRNTGRGDFPSSPFQLYTDVPDDGLKVPGRVVEDGTSQHWTRQECLRMMLLHMLGKGWCPVCVSDQFDVDDPSFDVFVQPFKEREKFGLVISWKNHFCDQLTDETWGNFSAMIKANQPRDEWHFITTPAESCRGKDMSTPERCKAEAARAMREEAGLSSVPSAISLVECTKGKYKTSVHALVCENPEVLFLLSTATLQARQNEFPWRCPHNWPGVIGKGYKKVFEKKVKAYRETCKPRWVPEQDFASVFDRKSQAAIAAVIDGVKARLHSV